MSIISHAAGGRGGHAVDENVHLGKRRGGPQVNWPEIWVRNERYRRWGRRDDQRVEVYPDYHVRQFGGWKDWHDSPRTLSPSPCPLPNRERGQFTLLWLPRTFSFRAANPGPDNERPLARPYPRHRRPRESARCAARLFLPWPRPRDR